MHMCCIKNPNWGNKKQINKADLQRGVLLYFDPS